ncbi:MAG TPA: AraC family transcriptional regulator [Gemmatimonadaceae bacterium]|nr:AraC family transcriptional regulator [Gemmatimonadaceae bacterium]
MITTAERPRSRARTRAGRAVAGGTAPTARDRARVVAYVARERARTALRAALSRRARLVVTRSRREFAGALQSAFTDLAVVDIGVPHEEGRRCALLARDFPSIAFLGVSPFHPVDAPLIAQCGELGFADVLADSVDDAQLSHAVRLHGYSARFARALHDPPPKLELRQPLQVDAWRAIVAHPGHTIRTEVVASTLGVSREHLSRTFSAGRAPNLKRVIDLVRLIAAAELAKNPGYDIPVVARLLNFASASHLTGAAQRLIGTRASSLSSLRGVDLVERFVRGRARSRA